MEINYPSQNTFANVDGVGIALCGSQPESSKTWQTHIALLYRLDTEPPQLLHLAGIPETKIYKNDPPNNYVWLDLGEDFSAMDKAILCAHIADIVNANKFNPFCFGFDSSTGGFIHPEKEQRRQVVQSLKFRAPHA